MKETAHGWELGSGLSTSAGLEEHIKALLNRLEGRAEPVGLLSATADVELSCVVYADSAPALNFEKSVIDRLARLGASLDIDLYPDLADSPG